MWDRTVLSSCSGAASGLGGSALRKPLSGPALPAGSRASVPLGQVLGGREPSVVVREAGPGVPWARGRSHQYQVTPATAGDFLPPKLPICHEGIIMGTFKKGRFEN